MAISRGSMTKQLEPGLGSSNKGWTKKEKAEFKKVLVKTHGKIYKPNSQKPKVQNLPLSSGTIKEVVQPQKGDVIHSKSGRYK